MIDKRIWVVIGLLAGVGAVRGQTCRPEWSTKFAPGNFDGDVRGMISYDDDGAGPRRPMLYAVGEFLLAGGYTARGAARWDGIGWSEVGGGLGGRVGSSTHMAFAVFDENTGGVPALFVGGDFTTAGGQSIPLLAKWDGTRWMRVGAGLTAATGSSVQALAVYDPDGAGPLPPALYCGGAFRLPGSSSTRFVATWDGRDWTPAVTGGPDATVMSFTVAPAGSVRSDQDVLVAGGVFTHAGAAAANHVAAWDGSAWSPLGVGFDENVFALTTFDDDGAGPRAPVLYAGGFFTYTGAAAASHLAAWDGTGWVETGGGVATPVEALQVADVDGAPAMLVGSRVTGQEVHLLSWDGAALREVGPALNGNIRALAVHDEGQRPTVFAAGAFTIADGQPVQRIARLANPGWQSVGDTPAGNGITGFVYSLATFTPPGGPASLIAGGTFNDAGGSTTLNIASWNGTAWSALGGGMDGGVYALASFDDDGAGPNPPVLVAGGEFFSADGVPATRVAAWDGSAWMPMGGAGMDDTILSLAVWDDDGPGPHPPRLYAGGWFTHADGATVNGIAVWDGLQWRPVGGGVSAVNSPRVEALGMYDDDVDGPHLPALYAAGSFSAMDGVPCSNIAKLDGATWSPVGTGVNGVVYALSSFDDDGAGPHAPSLFAGGLFGTAGGQAAGNIARWDGQAWHAVGTSLSNTVTVLREADLTGGGAALYAGGAFTGSGATPLDHIARWDGARWSALSAAGAGMPLALCPFVDGAHPALYCGGAIRTAAGVPSLNIARWGCPSAAFCSANCDGSTTPPILNVGDFVCFMGEFAAGDPYANCDGSTAAPVLNVNDFICFQLKFAAGCE